VNAQLSGIDVKCTLADIHSGLTSALSFLLFVLHMVMPPPPPRCFGWLVPLPLAAGVVGVAAAAVAAAASI